MRVQIPSGPFMVKAAFALALLLAACASSAIFLVGSGKAGQAVPILCEGQAAAFVSMPEGRTERLQLDSSFQAEFTPALGGPYAVQCGNETKIVSVEQSAQAADIEQGAGDAASAFLLASILLFIALMAIASFYMARTYLYGATRFCKRVEGNTARLSLVAGPAMERVEISDPVCIGRRGKELRFSIPALPAGCEWRHEYCIASPERALPAGLAAIVSGKKVSMLSEISIVGAGGAKPKATEALGNALGKNVTLDLKAQGSKKQKRKLPKAR